MFGLFKKKPTSNIHEAGEHTNLPLSNEMTMMLAQELPIVDSITRKQIYAALREYNGPTIERQEDLPEVVKEILDL